MKRRIPFLVSVNLMFIYPVRFSLSLSQWFLSDNIRFFYNKEFNLVKYRTGFGCNEYSGFLNGRGD